MAEAKVNRQYLDAALAGIDERVQSSMRREAAYTALITADSQATVDRARAELTFKTFIGSGIRALLVLVGIGLLVVLVSFAASLILSKLRAPLLVDGLGQIGAIAESSETRLEEMAASIEDLASRVGGLSSAKQTIVLTTPLGSAPVFSVPKTPFEPNSEACASGRSYVESCTEEQVFSNGATYVGEWLNGVPNGTGQLTLLEGGTLEGRWRDGALVSVVDQVPSEVVVEPIPILSVPKVPLDETSNSCPSTVSYEKVCSADKTLPNGSTYSGEWRDGVPNGNGRISFKEGGAIDGQWRDGTLISVAEQSVPETRTIRSVTFFESIAADSINPMFGDVVVGHRFLSSADETWASAYCYLQVFDETDKLRVELSGYASFESELSLLPYQANSRFSSREFFLAQQKCPYRRIGFR